MVDVGENRQLPRLLLKQEIFVFTPLRFRVATQHAEAAAGRIDKNAIKRL